MSRNKSPVFRAPAIVRAESFGAIVQTTTPRALLFVDRNYARDLLPASATPEAWLQPEPEDFTSAQLAAPLEAHLQLTNQCNAGCRSCYTGAVPAPTRAEWGLSEWMHAVDELARMGVFHLALGGGESADLPWLGQLARYAREQGLVPNLTTSGLSNLQNVIANADVFGQINVSLDGLGQVYGEVRGFDGFAQADAALKSLRAVKSEIGINVVVTRKNFFQLEDIVKYARDTRLSEVEFLRLKPAGRARHHFSEATCTHAQHLLFWPTVVRAAKRYAMRVRVDCSYTPMVAYHRPPVDLMRSLAVFGCTGGNYLIGAKADGTVSACSFADPPPMTAGDSPTVRELGEYWQDPHGFFPFREEVGILEPCKSCEYQTICRGGCRVVSGHVLKDWQKPDPECPKVVEWHAKNAQVERPKPPVHLPVVL